MSRSGIGISPAPSGSSQVDGELIASTNRFRETDQIGGALDEEVVAVKAAAPAADAYGLVVRPIPASEVAGVGIGAAADAAATGSGSVIGLLKRIRDLLLGGLPALTVGGKLPVDAAGTTLTVSGSVGVGAIIKDGQSTMAGSIPVAIASNQSAIPITVAAVPLPTGASTLVEQQTHTTALQLIDDIVHAVNGALSKVAAIGAQLDDTGTTAATENAIAPLRITSDRALHVQLRSGSADYGTSGAPLRTDPTGTTIQPVSGTVSTKTDLTGDAPFADTISTSEDQLLASTATRKGLLIVNTSASGQKLSLAFDGQAAVLDSGITLEAGDAWNMDEFSFTTGEVRWVGSAASTTCAGQQFLA